MLRKNLKQRVAVGACLALSAVSMTTWRGDAAVVVLYEGTFNTITPGVPLVGGSGTIFLGASCAGVSSAPAVVPLTAGCINASGTYTSTVCGTGTVDGTGTLWAPAVVGTTVSEALTFHIQFVAGVGAVTGTTGTRGSLLGTAQLLFPMQGTCVSPVTEFAVAGVLAMDF